MAKEMREPIESGCPDGWQYMHPVSRKNFGAWEYHDHPRPGVLRHVAKSGDELWTVRAGTQRILDVNTDQRIICRRQVPFDQCDVHSLVHVVVEADHAEITVACLDDLLADALDIALFLEPVADQVRNRAYFYVMGLRELLKIRAPRHGSIIVQNLDDCG